MYQMSSFHSKGCTPVQRETKFLRDNTDHHGSPSFCRLCKQRAEEHINEPELQPLALAESFTHNSMRVHSDFVAWIAIVLCVGAVAWHTFQGVAKASHLTMLSQPSTECRCSSDQDSVHSLVCRRGSRRKKVQRLDPCCMSCCFVQILETFAVFSLDTSQD